MRSRGRAVAHGVVLVVMAGLCVTTVTSGAFDVVTVPAAVPGPAPSAETGDGVAAPGAPEGGAPADGQTDGTTGTGDAGAPDEACVAAGRAWGDAAKAQLDVSVEHPEGLVAGFTTARDTLAGAEPPGAIARDWDVVSTYTAMIADAVEAAGAQDRAELARSLDRVGRRIDTAALTDASQRVTEFLQAGCPA